ncbi:sodium:alanine symporter family protein, partial [Bacillus licheniformis]|uniref:alanine:cation symporter family protein n=1 Tax=Bacillus licheniformis TaxID=1402 RepID=UPI000F9E222C
LTFFAFTTIVGWYYFGETNVRFLFGSKALTPYRVLVMVAIIFGSMQKVDLVWTMSDVANELMVIPNIIALLALSFEVKSIFKDYKSDVAKGKLDYDYAPEARASEK